MRIILATAHPHIPQIAGGSQSSTDTLASQLIERGHDCAVLAGLTKPGLTGLRTRVALRLGQPYGSDRTLGYKTMRTWHPWSVADEVLARERPDVVIAQSGWPGKISAAFKAVGVPVMIFFRNVEADDLIDVHRTVADGYLANSRYTAREMRERFGVEAEVIPPFFDPQRYRVPRIGGAVTLINPSMNKGLEIALGLARRFPDQPFLFVMTQQETLEEKALVQAAQSTTPNIRVVGPFQDMRRVYEQTRILLMPSRWEEAWGRVASEAHFSGIPVLASDRGGIRESVGPGGAVIAAGASLETWAAALGRMLFDPDHFRKLSDAALEFSARDELRIDHQVARLERACQHVIASKR